MWGVLSDERTGLSFTAVVVTSTCRLYLQSYLLAFYSVVRSPVPSGLILFTVLHVTIGYTSVQGLCQSRIGTADDALTNVARVTTVVYSLEQSYA
jgi:CHASE2 domain-containing sensor protein